MAIPNGVIFIWTGTNVSIPAGWQRVTDLDDKFPKSNTDSSTNPNVTGGTSTHTHTGSSHTHTMQSHTHTISYGVASGTIEDSGASDQNGVSSDHAHPSQTSGGPTNVSVSSVSVTYTSVSNNPPFYTVIYITPTSTVGGIPNLSLGLSDDSGFSNNTGKYNGYYKCDGNNSTPDLTDRYLAGATTGANAGTTGGSLTNAHTLTHTHSITHDHAQLTTPVSAGPFNSSTGGSDMASKTHTHTTTINSASNSTSDTPSTTTTETVEPAFKKLLAIQNRSGTIYTPVGIIGLWLGTIANIPSNFEIVSSMYGNHLKITNTNGDIGNTGGSNTHTHASSSHTHSAVSHTHTASGLGHTGSNQNQNTGAVVTSTNSVHSATITSVNIEMGSANTTADSSSNEPEFGTVAFIKYKGEKGGSFIFNLLR